MQVLEFDAALHEYRLGGRVLPSVTQILGDVGFYERVGMDPWYAERGTAVHEYCQLDDEDDLAEESVTPEMKGYLEAWRRFRKESKAKVLSIEERIYHPVYGYAGTLDRIVKIGRDEAIVDLKTGSPARWHAIQTGAYAAAKQGKAPYRRFACYLKDDGSYSLQEHKDRADGAVWLSALTVWKWRFGKERG